MRSLAFVGTKLMIMDKPPTLAQAVSGRVGDPRGRRSMAAAMFAAAFALNNDDAGAFVTFLAFLGTAVTVLFRVGVMGWLSAPFLSGTSGC